MQSPKSLPRKVRQEANPTQGKPEVCFLDVAPLGPSWRGLHFMVAGGKLPILPLPPRRALPRLAQGGGQILRRWPPRGPCPQLGTIPPCPLTCGRTCGLLWQRWSRPCFASSPTIGRKLTQLVEVLPILVQPCAALLMSCFQGPQAVRVSLPFRPSLAHEPAPGTPSDH